MSPVAMVKKGLAPEFSAEQQALYQVSYHVRALEKDGCISLKETVPRRGFAEHIFKGTNHQKGPPKGGRSRARFYRNSALGLIARIAGAIDRETFHSEIDPVVDWSVVCLDREGWSEIRDSFKRCSDEHKRIVEAVRQRSKNRDSGELVLGTLALLAFESPLYPGVVDCPPPERTE